MSQPTMVITGASYGLGAAITPFRAQPGAESPARLEW
jgi:short-subunit dehydrogenase